MPFHITNTPVLAQEWAKSILTLLRDFARMGLVRSDVPVEVFEIGPGTGRHAYFLWKELKRLEPLTRAICSEGLRFRLHLAELGVSGLKSLAEHSHWQQAIQQGDLLLHQFDVDSDEQPKVFFPSEADFGLPSKNPTFLINNYILDSLPHDVLRIAEGRVQKGLTKVQVRGLKKGVEPTDLVDLGERILLSFSYSEHDTQYPDEHWNEVVESYRHLEETHIPFPTSPMRLAGRARHWSEIANVLLVADKSFTTMEQLRQLEEPELVPHGGGFSFNANLHALGLLAEAMGGLVHHSPSRDGTLDLSHIVFPSPSQKSEQWDFLESKFRYEELDNFHAVDRFRTKESVDELHKDYPLRLCLDLLRLGGFDPQIFYELSDDILRGIDGNTEDSDEMELELAGALPKCLDLLYPLPDDVDVAFEIGRVAYRMESYRLAHHAFLLSLEQYGDDPRTRFNLGLTWYYRDEYEKANLEFERAVALDGQYQEAKLWCGKTSQKLRSAASVTCS